MKKPELVNEVAKATGHPKKVVREILASASDAIKRAVFSGSVATVLGLGRLSKRERGPRTGRNIRTGETVMIPPGPTVRFVPSSSLVEGVRRGSKAEVRGEEDDR